MTRQKLLDVLQFNDQGLIPAVIQDAASKRVLTLCYLNREALERSLREGKVYVFRRSRNRLMLKGETSGHIQRIKQVHVDCEGQSLLLVVQQHVAGCHQGYLSCYFRRRNRQGRLVISEPRVFDPSKVYKR
ncbi:MAG: phosphoribosyl-AMP cyclohydrolase [Candidatus Omnitrophica bacterium]|nr:phosphoribosyl-AMP cyclohydrolase [Candidatus Omnitrophota bacterium]